MILLQFIEKFEPDPIYGTLKLEIIIKRIILLQFKEKFEPDPVF